MSRNKHAEATIIAALKQVEAGRKVEDVAREQAVSKAHRLCLESKVRGHGGERGRRGEASAG